MERPKEELESVMPKTIEWLRAIAPQQSDPVHAARILIASDTIERQAKEIAEFNTEANRLVSVNRALVKDRDKFEADYLKYYDIGHNCSIQLRHAQQERDAALAEVERLKALLKSAVDFADEAWAKWDADEDVRVGKMLIALAGGLPKYRPETDAIHAALKS